MDKEGNMSLNVIVKAVIVLVVMVVLIAIFTGRIVIFNNELDSCSVSKSGECSSLNCEDLDGTYKIMTGEYSDCTAEQVCCIKTG